MAQAASLSGNYNLPVSIIGAGGGSNSSTNFTGTGIAGGPPGGKTTSPNYINIGGGAGSILIAADAGKPVILNFKIDGKTIVNGDYIKKDGTLTATVTDETGIDTNLSSVEVGGDFTTFRSLTGASTYDASTGGLTFKLNIATDGDHIISIHAVDVSGNSRTVSRTVKVDTSELKAVSVFMYPNPFNPNTGAGVIAYQLNKEAETSVYIFNAIGQLIYRRNYIAGSSGAQVGYNEVPWDGRSDFGEIVGNDVYFLRVVSGGKPVGRTKIAVIK